MTVAVNQPQRKNLLGDLIQAIGVATSIYGAKLDSDKLDLLRQQADAEQDDKARQAIERFSMQFEEVPKEQAVGGLMPPENSGLMPKEGYGFRPRSVGDKEKAFQLQKTRLGQDKESQLASSFLDLKKAQLQVQKLEKEIGGQAGKPLSAKDIEFFGQGRNAVQQLNILSDTIDKYKSKLGPIKGGVSAINPYDVDAQTVQAAVNTAKQTIGKYLEGGVLRKEDEEKYARILPKLTDNPEVAINKLNMVRELLQTKINSDSAALEQQGYNITGIMPDSQRQPISVKEDTSGQALAAPKGPQKYTPGSLIRAKGKVYRVGPDGNELIPMD